MPSHLTFSAIELNQYLNKIQFPIFPLQWCKTKRSWFFKNHKYLKCTNTFFYYCLILKLVVALLFVKLLLSITQNKATYFELEHQFVVFVTLLAVLSSATTDVISNQFLRTTAVCCSWCFKCEKSWFPQCTLLQEKDLNKFYPKFIFLWYTIGKQILRDVMLVQC